ncbi:hypothetical protein BFW01_g2125 [Lasiodiplodia theobromae]|nr:hypothetical protein BFW01_g2125 [Lasiodiplodia theobromae]
MIPTQLCTRSLRSVSPAASVTPTSPLLVVPPTLLRRPFSTTRPSLSAPPPAQDDGASKPLIRHVLVDHNPDFLVKLPPAPKPDLAPELRLLEGIEPTLKGLLHETPFRVSAPTTPRTHAIRKEFGGATVPEYARRGAALDRAYLFATPEAAFEFVYAVESRIARPKRHYPMWGGCGRRVYVRWKSHGYADTRRAGSRTGISIQDIESAFETEQMARDIASRDRRGRGAAVRCDDWYERLGKDNSENPAGKIRRTAGHKRNDVESYFPVAFWPEEEQRLPGELKAGSRLMIWDWVRKNAWTPAVYYQGQEFYPAWSAMWGGALVSRPRWRLNDEGGMGRLVLSSSSREEMMENRTTWGDESLRMLENHDRGRLLFRMMWRAAPDVPYRGVKKGRKRPGFHQDTHEDTHQDAFSAYGW